MDTDSLRSPSGSESQDEWGSGLWMDAENDFADERRRVGPRAPRAQEEDTHSVSPEQQQIGTESSSATKDEHFSSPSPPCTVGDRVTETNSYQAGMDDENKDQKKSPPVPARADKPVQMFMDKESFEGSDSIVFLSKESEEKDIDYKPLDFASARKQWIRRDSSSSKPPTPTFSRSSSRNLITEEYPVVHQGEPNAHNPAPNTENQEVQQVCNPAPPLDMVAGEQGANPDPESLSCSAIMVKEPLTDATGGWRQGRRESEQTDRERKHSLSGSDAVDTRRESKAEGLRKEVKTLTFTDAQIAEIASRMDPDQFEDSQSDSGVSADFSPNSTTDISSTSIASSSPDLNETPIEREIRLAIKREQSLRRSRGWNPAEDKEKEFVEIRVRKSILSHDLPLKSMKSEGKDRQFAGKKMQKEIRAEAEREKALVQLGRLPGFYDKGTVRQLREKKLLFEAFQEPKEALEILTKRPSSVTLCEISCGGIQVNETSGFLKKRAQNLDRLVQDTNGNCPTVGELTLSGPCGPGLTEGTKGQVIILENTPSPVTQMENSTNMSVTVVESGRYFSVKPYSGRNQDEGSNNDEELAPLNENPFFKLRSSLSLRPDVQQDIQEARDREKALRKQRTSLYGQGSEVEGARSPTNTPLTHSNQTTLEQPAKTSVTITTTSVRQSLGKLDLMWPPPPPPQEEHKALHEVHKSSMRQKSMLLQRWENGLVNGQGQQQE